MARFVVMDDIHGSSKHFFTFKRAMAEVNIRLEQLKHKRHKTRVFIIENTFEFDNQVVASVELD